MSIFSLSKLTLYNDDDMNLRSLLFYIPHTHTTHHIFYSHSKLRQTLAKREKQTSMMIIIMMMMEWVHYRLNSIQFNE